MSDKTTNEVILDYLKITGVFWAIITALYAAFYSVLEKSFGGILESRGIVLCKIR